MEVGSIVTATVGAPMAGHVATGHAIATALDPAAPRGDLAATGARRLCKRPGWS